MCTCLKYFNLCSTSSGSLMCKKWKVIFSCKRVVTSLLLPHATVLE